MTKTVQCDVGIDVVIENELNDNESEIYNGVENTEFIDSDNDIAEIEYNNSTTINFLLTAHPLEVMRRIGLITKFTKIAYDKAISKSASGLTEKSIIRRWGRKQYALSNAVMKYVRETNKKLYRRLFRDNEPLWNLLFAITITEFDKVLDKE